MRCNAVIFDLDGTLANTLSDISSAMNQMLAQYSFPTHDLDSYRKWVGQGARRLVELVLPAGKQSLTDEALRRFREIYLEALVVETHAYPEVPEMLEALAATGIRMSVLSNKPHDMTRRLVETLFRKVEFVDVIGQRQGIPRKPDPTSALELAQRMRVPVSRCAVVGDSEYDMEMGRAAGMLPVGVLWGFREEEALREAGAALVCDTPAEVVKSLVD